MNAQKALQRRLFRAKGVLKKKEQNGNVFAVAGKK
jgi:hypothetical protein